MRKANVKSKNKDVKKKKTRQGNSKFTKRGSCGPKGQSKHYKKKYRGQGKR